MVEGAEGCGVTERSVDIGGAEALAKQQDLPRLRAPDAGRAEAHEPEEGRGALAHSFEGHLDLIEVDRALALRRRMELGRV